MTVKGARQGKILRSLLFKTIVLVSVLQVKTQTIKASNIRYLKLQPVAVKEDNNIKQLITKTNLVLQRKQ